MVLVELIKDNDLKSRVMYSLAWLGGMRYIGQFISWGITIIVIRILTPGDYGLMAMASVCTNFLFMVSELGLGAAIIQKKELDPHQLSQIFGFIILSHATLSCALFFSSSLIATYFLEPRLTPILQVLSLNFLLLSLYVIPDSLLSRQMNFKKKSAVDLIATVLSACFILLLALYGYGVWSLVWGTVLMHILRLIGYNLMHHDFILPSFRLKGIEEFISFGAYTIGSRLLWYFYSKSDILIGGRILGNQLIGIYSVALELSAIPMDKFMPIINQVAFPAYARIQSDLQQVGSYFLKACRMISLLVFPAFWGLLSIAPEFLGWLLGSKWTDVIFPIQILCVIMPFTALGTLIPPMLFGIGRVDIHFLYVTIAAILMPLFFFSASVYGGIVGICLAWVFGYTILFLITLKLSLPLLKLSIPDFFSNILIAPFASAVMMGVVSASKYLMYSLPLPIINLMMILIGIITYCAFIFFVKREVFYEIRSLISK